MKLKFKEGDKVWWDGKCDARTTPFTPQFVEIITTKLPKGNHDYSISCEEFPVSPYFVMECNLSLKSKS